VEALWGLTSLASPCTHGVAEALPQTADHSEPLGPPRSSTYCLGSSSLSRKPGRGWCKPGLGCGEGTQARCTLQTPLVNTTGQWDAVVSLQGGGRARKETWKPDMEPAPTDSERVSCQRTPWWLGPPPERPAFGGHCAQASHTQTTPHPPHPAVRPADNTRRKSCLSSRPRGAGDGQPQAVKTGKGQKHSTQPSVPESLRPVPRSVQSQLVRTALQCCLGFILSFTEL
jgi:hypothetical protein